jgi:hypothetical protein
LREFGTWQLPGVGLYTEGREGFVPPKDWVVGTAPRAADAGNPGRATKKKKKGAK